MRAQSIVKTEPISDDPLCLKAVFHFGEVNSLLLQRSPEPLDENIIEKAATPVHGYFDFRLLQGFDPVRTRELTALVGIEDLRLAETCKRLL